MCCLTASGCGLLRGESRSRSVGHSKQQIALEEVPSILDTPPWLVVVASGSLRHGDTKPGPFPSLWGEASAGARAGRERSEDGGMAVLAVTAETTSFVGGSPSKTPCTQDGRGSYGKVVILRDFAESSGSFCGLGKVSLSDHSFFCQEQRR